jgi:hypothetical protein
MEEQAFSTNSEEVTALPPNIGAGSQDSKQGSLRMNLHTCNSSPSSQITIQLPETNQYPITVKGDEMMMVPQLMRPGRMYPFTYGDETLLVKKTRTGKIIIYEVLENGSND